MQGTCHLKGYLKKDPATNRVSVTETPQEDALPIETEYRVLACSEYATLLEVLLITGRSHQIRAHLASIGHPIIGDPKYGRQGTNERYSRAYGVRHQLLHAYRLEFPQMEEPFAYLSGQVFTAPLPPVYGKLIPYEG
jgi:23S rRNA pseudouridine955/2504/2580 synthase